MPAANSGQAQFGHFGKLIIFVSLYPHRRLKNFGRQTRTSAKLQTVSSNAL